MRSLILLLVGLFIGTAMTLIGLSYLQRGTSYPEGVMAVMGGQLKGLDRSIELNRCGSADLVPRLQILRLVANEIEPAFADLQQDTQFIRYASDLRAAVDASLSLPPGSCKAAATIVSQLDKTCDACHRDYRN